MKKTFVTLSIFAFFLAFEPTYATDVSKKISIPNVSSREPGVHYWSAFNGRLILVNGTYEDILTYKRSLAFYFEKQPGSQWTHVPVFDSESGYRVIFWTISQGEQTIADAGVKQDNDGIKLVTAQTKPGAYSSITVAWYRFTFDNNSDPDRPAYFFEKISSAIYKASTSLTIEELLEKELTKNIKN